MFDESKHPRADDGKFADGKGRTNSEKLKEAERVYNSEPSSTMVQAKKKMTPAEKIASVHIDFDKDNILPELNEEDIAKIGSKVNKPVLLKKHIIDRNRTEHSDITDDDFQKIITTALYSPSDIIPANKNKPYFHFAKVVEVNSKGKPEIGLALLDVDENKDNFEIVHAQLMRERSFNSIKNRK